MLTQRLARALRPMSFQAYIDNIKAKTGKTPDQLFAAAKEGWHLVRT